MLGNSARNLVLPSTRRLWIAQNARPSESIEPYSLTLPAIGVGIDDSRSCAVKIPNHYFRGLV